MSPYSTCLDSKQKEIRVLILEPSRTGGPITCLTETVSLLDNPGFEALSYVWGDASIKESIFFDGVPFLVTKNLFTALHHLRLEDRPRRLWVDALCINQNDIKERNEQVTMMGEIYIHAKPVVIFLGEADEDSDELFKSISTAGEDNEISEEDSPRLFSLYMCLVEREWFTRLWTIQELVLATQDPLIGCGFSWTTWSKLLKVWQRVALREFSKMDMVVEEDEEEVEGKQGELSSKRPNGIKVDLLNNLRTAVGNNGGEELRNLLLNTVSANATEPKDRIYGLLGMMNDEDRKCLTVDYSRALGVVYAESIAHIFQKGTGTFGGPFLLCGLELAGPSPTDPSCPSWVPMFGRKDILRPIRYHPAGVGASGAGSGAKNGIVDPDLKTLRVRGMHIDIVSEKISVGEEEQCLAQLPNIEALVRKAHELAERNLEHRHYLKPFKTKEPVWRTLIANKEYSGAAREVAPELYGEMYESLLEQANGDRVEDDKQEDFVRDFRLALLNKLGGSCFFVTETGFYGIGQESVEIGDHLAIWFGAPAPFVMKAISQKSGENGDAKYSVRGAAYVAGIMDGEMVDEVYCEDLEDDIEFVIQ